MKLLVYGTLRKGCPNHFYLDRPDDEVKYLETYTMHGFYMYISKGATYPSVHHDIGSHIVVEIYDIQSIPVLFNICELELPYGYNIYRNELGTIFTRNPFLTSIERIPHGDWVKYYRGSNVPII